MASPATVEGAVLSVADKADSVAGMFALGLIPSGSKDPFALRRQANGMVKTIAEHKLPLRLSEIMADARVCYKGSEAEKKFSNSAYAESVRSFFRERLEFYLKDARGYAYDVVSAVLAVDSDDVVDAVKRAEAVSKARSSERAGDLEAVCISFKRIKNILKQAEEKHISIPENPNEDLMDKIEMELWYQVINLGKRYEVFRKSGVYELVVSHTAALRPYLDKFFDEVMVMVDDEQVRANRLALLQKLYKQFSTIADFSKIVTEGKESTK